MSAPFKFLPVHHHLSSFLFNDAVSFTDYIASKNRMINELEGMWKWSWPNLRYHPNIFLVELRKTMKNVLQDSWCVDQDLNLVFPKQEMSAIVAITKLHTSRSQLQREQWSPGE
jgi:hypothetical protein